MLLKIHVSKINLVLTNKHLASTKRPSENVLYAISEAEHMFLLYRLLTLSILIYWFETGSWATRIHVICIKNEV